MKTAHAGYTLQTATNNQSTRHSSTQKTSSQHHAAALLHALRSSSNGNGLASQAVDAAMVNCASHLLQEAVEAEVDNYLQQFRQRGDWIGVPPIVRNGHHPGRIFLTNIGPVTVHIPKLRGRPDGTPAFESTLLQKYQRRARTGGTGAQWHFLRSLAKGDWATLFIDLLGLTGLRVTELPQASKAWQRHESRAILNTTLLETGQWTDIRTKAFALPADCLLRTSSGGSSGSETILAVAAKGNDGEWQLIKCRTTGRISDEVWQTLACTLSERGFAMAHAA